MGFLDVLGTIASPISSAVGAVANYFSTKETNASNRAINESNNQFNAEQAQINRDFQSQQSKEQNEWNAKQAKDAFNWSADFAREMFKAENEYNSPANQLKLMREAGLNPNTFNVGVSQANGSVPSASAASGSAPSGSAASASSPIAMQAPNLDTSFTASLLQAPLMREQLESIRLANRDKRNEIKAKEKPRETFGDLSDDFIGNLVVDRVLQNAYSADAERSILENEERKLRAKLTDEQRRNARMQNDMLNAGMPYLSEMPKHQLQSLLEDIRSKVLSNTLLEDDVNLQKTYGISSKDSNGFTTFLRVLLRDPDNASRMLDTLVKAVTKFGETGIDKVKTAFNGISSW